LTKKVLNFTNVYHNFVHYNHLDNCIYNMDLYYYYYLSMYHYCDMEQQSTDLCISKLHIILKIILLGKWKQVFKDFSPVQTSSLLVIRCTNLYHSYIPNSHSHMYNYNTVSYRYCRMCLNWRRDQYCYKKLFFFMN
jgi:hypothetical protein